MNDIRPRRALVALLAGLLLLTGALPASAGPAFTVGGHVSSAVGQPVSGATVQLISPHAGILATATTGSDGTYALAAGAADAVDYRIRVWAQGFAMGEATWVPAVDTRQVAIQLADLSGRLYGRVLDDAGRAVGGAAVQLWRSGAGLAAATTSGSDGSYHFDGLTAGDSYLLQVSAAGFLPARPAVPPLRSGGAAYVDAVLTAAAGTVSGQAVDRGTGAPVAAHVLLLRRGLGIAAAADTDSSGGFSFQVLAATATDYVVRLWADGYATYTSDYFALPGGTRHDLAGQDQISLTPLYGEVAGFIGDGNGNPRVGMAVQLDRQGYGTIDSAVTDSDGWYVFRNVTGGDAATLRVRVPAGGGWMPVTDSPWFALPGGALYQADLAVPTVGTGTQGFGTLSGRVTDEGGLPLAGVTVRARRSTDNGADSTATTDADGRYHLSLPANRTGAPYGNAPGYRVAVAADGYFANDQPVVSGAPVPLVDVTTGRFTAADFTLKARRGRIGGRVLDLQGSPLAGVTVQLYREGSAAPMAATASDSNGRYSFASVPVMGRAGYLVVAGASGYFASALGKDGNAAAPLTDAAGGVGALVDLRLTPAAGALTGTVQDGSGRPVGGATVTATDSQGDSVAYVTDQSGAYDLEGLNADGRTWLLSATAPGFQTSALTPSGSLLPVLALTGGSRPSEVLELLPAQGSVAGVVRAADGTPVVGADVGLWQEGAGPVATTRADDQGRYRFDQVAPGYRYSIQAARDGYVASALQYGLGSVPAPIRVEGGDHVTWDPLLLASPQ